jgi:hypothetical protein
VQSFIVQDFPDGGGRCPAGPDSGCSCECLAAVHAEGEYAKLTDILDCYPYVDDQDAGAHRVYCVVQGYCE